MSRPLKQTAHLLRTITERPDSRDVAVLRAGTELRKARGLYRDLYSTEEIDLISSARLIAYQFGQVRLGRFVTLRTRWQKRRSVKLGGRFHECPKCGLRHTEPQRTWTPPKSKRAEEKRLVEGALERAPQARRG